MMPALPPHVLADARRVLDRAARRLLAAQMNGDAFDAPARHDDSTVGDGADQVSLLIDGQPVPVTSRDGHCGHERAA